MRDLFTLQKADMKKKTTSSKLEVSNPYLRQRLEWYGEEEHLGMDISIEFHVRDKRTSLRSWKQGCQQPFGAKKKSWGCQEAQSVSKATLEERYQEADQHGAGASQNLEASGGNVGKEEICFF